MYTLATILERLRAYKPELQRKYPISRLGSFGSYARGEATESSDIDVAVELNGPMGLNFVAMANEMEELFGTKVDVVPKRSIKSPANSMDINQRHAKQTNPRIFRYRSATSLEYDQE